MLDASGDLLPLFRRFERTSRLDDEDRTSLTALPLFPQTIPGRRLLVRQGDAQQSCFLLLSGFAQRSRITAEGQRQITAFYVPGDLFALQGGADLIAANDIQMLTAGRVVAIRLGDLMQLAHRHPAIARALLAEALGSAAIACDWMVNLGRRDARGRILNLMCELSLRLELAGIGKRDRFELPFTQIDLADATGLTPVHVNRVLQALTADGTIERRGRAIHLPNWDEVAREADFQQRA